MAANVQRLYSLGCIVSWLKDRAVKGIVVLRNGQCVREIMRGGRKVRRKMGNNLMNRRVDAYAA